MRISRAGRRDDGAWSRSMADRHIVPRPGAASIRRRWKLHGRVFAGQSGQRYVRAGSARSRAKSDTAALKRECCPRCLLPRQFRSRLYPRGSRAPCRHLTMRLEATQCALSGCGAKAQARCRQWLQIGASAEDRPGQCLRRKRRRLTEAGRRSLPATPICRRGKRVRLSAYLGRSNTSTSASRASASTISGSPMTCTASPADSTCPLTVRLPRATCT